MSVKKAVSTKNNRLLEGKYQDASLALNFSNPLQLLVSTILAAQLARQRIRHARIVYYLTFANGKTKGGNRNYEY